MMNLLKLPSSVSVVLVEMLLTMMRPFRLIFSKVFETIGLQTVALKGHKTPMTLAILWLSAIFVLRML
jgi:hypothetical protein